MDNQTICSISDEHKDNIFEVVAIPTTIYSFILVNTPVPKDSTDLPNYFKIDKALIPSTLFSDSLKPGSEKIAPATIWDHNYIPEWNKIVEERRQAIVSKCKIGFRIESEEYQDYFETKALQEKALKLSSVLEQVKSQNIQNKEECDILTQKVTNLEALHNCSKKNMPTPAQDTRTKRTYTSRVKNTRKAIQSTNETSDTTSSEANFTSINPPSSKPLSIKMRKWIYERCNVKNKNELIKYLQDLAYDHSLYQYPTDEQALVQWKKKEHLLIKKINQYFLCYCPCTQAILINTGSYSTLLQELPREFFCVQPCHNSTLAMKECMANFNVYDTITLEKRLKSLVHDLYINPKHTITDAHFDPKNHILIGKINDSWVYVFCPCKELTGCIGNQKYPCSFDNLKQKNDVPKDFLCKNTCKYYSPKENAVNEKGSEYIFTKSDIDNI